MISDRALDRLAGLFDAPDVSGTRYEILSELGRGGMGVVYLARDTVLDREVALKVIERVDGGAPGSTLAALAHEARILARLEHPGIVPVHDFGELPDGGLYYAMKRVRGVRLDRWLTAAHDVPERLGVFVKVCDALAFAHADRIVHRDVKPENVMIGEFGEVLVLDWGIARTQNDNPEPRNENPEPRNENPEHRTPNAEPIVGTPEYMAPEQRLGGHIDHRADIYALGIVLARIAGDAAPIAAIAAKASAEDPGARYQTVHDLTADVQRFLSGGAVAAYREPVFDRLRRLYRRHRMPILLVLTYLAVRALLLWIGGI
jgi:serine/threonine protein kinase